MDWSSLRIGNAAGFVKGPGKLFENLLRSPATDITIGSITLMERAGNPGNVYSWANDGTSVNALGLPNPGATRTQEIAPLLLKQCQDAGKQLRFSIAGFSPEEYLTVAHMLGPFGKLEINFGCPNVWGEGGQKPIAAFAIDLMDKLLEDLPIVAQDSVDIKLSPYSDPSMIPRIATMLKKHRVSNVVTSNTFANGLVFANGKPLLDTPGGFGGVGGNALHPIALGQVAQFSRELAGSDIGIIGVGGNNTFERVTAMLAAGAMGIQIGTEFGEYGAKIFSEIFERAPLPLPK